MQTLSKQLPPLVPLVAFEAAARHMSFTRAAGELNLSQAAVSQQIRNLEGYLGADLFIRSHRAVRLSARGRELQHTVTAVLQQLAIATAEIKSPEAHVRLTVGVDQSIAAMWLMPRLPRFQQAYPDVSVRIIASDDEEDCLQEDIDLAIIHGNGHWSGFESLRLFSEEIFPVCSPEYIERHGGPGGLESLVGQTLLDLDDTHWDWMNWRTWLSRNGVHLPGRHRALQVNSYPMLIEAARNGQGVALGWKYLVDADLASGRLIRPVDAAVGTDLGYYLVWSSGRDISVPAGIFRHWCAQEQAEKV